MDKFIIACHNPDNTIRLTASILLKVCGVMDNSTNYHADEAVISTIDNGIDIVRRIKEILDKGKITTRRIDITNIQLKNNRTMKHHSTHTIKIIVRQER